MIFAELLRAAVGSSISHSSRCEGGPRRCLTIALLDELTIALEDNGDFSITSSLLYTRCLGGGGGGGRNEDIFWLALLSLPRLGGGGHLTLTAVSVDFLRGGGAG